MTAYEFLQQHREPLPDWLALVTPESVFSREEFFGSRVVYYPGSGTDGHAVKLFGSTAAAHCFVYADYGVTQAQLEAELAKPRKRFIGYQTLARLQLQEADLVPGPWTPHVRQRDIERAQAQNPRLAQAPFGFLEVLERIPKKDDRHGPRRLAVLFLAAYGAAAYDALFCQPYSRGAPFALLLQDHGCGDNYDKFGAGGLLERIAQTTQVLPPWLLVAEGSRTQPWAGYEQVPGVEGDVGGMHDNWRYLFGRRGGGKPNFGSDEEHRDEAGEFLRFIGV